jgi:hypothetical protein
MLAALISRTIGRPASQLRYQPSPDAPAPGNVIQIEVPRRPPVRETDFEAPAQGGGFVENDADAIGHPTYPCQAAI